MAKPPPKTINTKIFIEPRDAAQLIGEEAFGQYWQPELIDDEEAPEFALVVKYLRAALQSGQVIATWKTLDFYSFGDLTPQDADREFFQINLEKNLVFHATVNDYVYCDIHSGQLRSFMRGQGIWTESAKQSAADMCLEWLIELFGDPNYNPPKMEDHMKLAKEKFPSLSNAAYKKARKRAIEETNRHDISKAGRRKNSDQIPT